MNRRNFIKGAMSALAGFTILPGAGRVWRATYTTPADPWAVPYAYELLGKPYRLIPLASIDQIPGDEPHRLYRILPRPNPDHDPFGNVRAIKIRDWCSLEVNLDALET